MRVGVVGAGMAGLAAARTLQAEGHEAVVFEKSRGLGGRAATRRQGGFVWDTGATAIPEELAKLMDPTGFVRIEKPVWLHEDLKPRPGDPQKGAHYALSEGMNGLGKRLAQGLDVRRETRIESISKSGEGFEVAGERFDALVLTPPIPQTRALLETLNETRSLNVEYRPCLSILLGFDVPLPETPYAALLDPTGAHPLQWLSLESAKCPGRAPEGGLALVCQMSAEFSKANYDRPPEDLVPLACEYLTNLYGPAFARPTASDVMRWRYSQPLQTADPDAVNPPGSRLVVASDGLRGGKLHHAYESGREAAQRLYGGR